MQEVKPRTEWTVFNDEHVASEPKNWEGVIEHCLEFRSYPTILFFEKLDPDEDYSPSRDFSLLSYTLDKLLQLGKKCDVLYSTNFEDMYSSEMKAKQLLIERELLKDREPAAVIKEEAVQ